MNGDETIYENEAKSAFNTPAPSQRNSSKVSMPDMNLANSRKIISFYQQYPEFLADPRTTHAANSDFAMAARIIGMNTTLERLNAQTKAAENKNFISLDGQKKLSEVLALDPSSVADDLLPDSEGTMPIMTGARYRMINELHKSIVLQTIKKKEFAPGPIKTAFDNADAADDAGKPEEAEVHRAYGRSLAGLSSKSSDAVSDKAKASNLKKLQDLDFKLAQEFAKHQKEFRVATSLEDATEIKKAEASALAVKQQRDELAPQITALESPAASAPAAKTTSRVSTKEEFDKLPAGEFEWTYPDGTVKRGVKP